MARLNKIILYVADRDTGKSTFAIETIKAQTKKVLVVDTVDHPMYREFQLIDIKRVPYWTSGIKRIITNNNRIKEDAAFLSKHLNNTFILFEDATKYLRTNTPSTVFNLIYDCKQVNNDIMAIYHGFKKILPETLDNSDLLTLGLLSENISRYQDKIPDYDKVLQLQQKVNALCKKKKSKYERLTIEI